MPTKRRRHEDQSQRSGGGGGGKRSRRRKHLYLVLDDREDGFTIHKIDPDSLDGSGSDSDNAAGDLPAPAPDATPCGVPPRAGHGRLCRRRRRRSAATSASPRTPCTAAPRRPHHLHDHRSPACSRRSLGHVLVQRRGFCAEVPWAHGGWGLPFVGEGHFDGELDAWVGLHRDGYVCSCRVASRSSSPAATVELDWQMTKEKLFFKNMETHGRLSHLLGQKQILPHRESGARGTRGRGGG
ncbi:hypothetical protein ACP70R_005012 [Stipagrostis hirtigluma subsp. patula]